MNENILVKIGSDITEFSRDMRTIDRSLKGLSPTAMAMGNEMKNAFLLQRAAMSGLREDLIGVDYDYFKLAQSSKEYAGTTKEFMSEVESLGKRHKKVTDAMVAGDELRKQSFFRTVGAMITRSTQASKISENFTRMGNPLYTVNNGLLSVADNLNKIALNGSPAALALKQLGPTASMKQLNDMTRMINQGLMRMTMVALAATVASVAMYTALHKGAMELDKQYKETVGTMGATIKKAFEPMVQVFADIMKPVYEFITAIAAMIVRFNEAHPTMAKLIAAFLVLIPILTLILSPLAVGIGLFGGLQAAMHAVWMIAGPLITGLAAMMGTVLLVSAAIVGISAALIYAYKNFEWFRNGVHTVLNFLKTTFTTVWNAIKGVVTQALTAIVAFGQTQLAKFAAFWKENGAQIITIAKAAFAVLTANIRIAMGIIKGVFEIIWPIISNVVRIAWEAIKLIISNVMTLILGIIEVGLKILKGDWSGAWETIKQMTFTMMGNVISFLRNIDLVQVGKDIINGLIKGVGSMAGAMLDTVKSIGNSIKDAFTGIFDIHSPSRWMRDMIGENMVRGWINGITGMKSNMLRATAQMGEWMSPNPTMAYATPTASKLSKTARLSDSSTSVSGNSPTTNNYYATVDAKNVKDFTDVVKLFSTQTINRR